MGCGLNVWNRMATQDATTMIQRYCFYQLASLCFSCFFLLCFEVVLTQVMFSHISSGTLKWTSWICGSCSSVCLQACCSARWPCCCACLGCVRPAAAQTSLSRTSKLSNSWSTVRAATWWLGRSCSWVEPSPSPPQCGSCSALRLWTSDMTTSSLMGLLYM